jgi:hypothetical protein
MLTNGTVLDLSGNSIVTMEGLKDLKLLTWLRHHARGIRLIFPSSTVYSKRLIFQTTFPAKVYKSF